MKTKQSNFIVSLNLIKKLDSIRGSYIVADILMTHLFELQSDQYHFFDILDTGDVMCVSRNHTVNTSLFRWTRKMLTDNMVSNQYNSSLMVNYGITDSDIEKFGNHLKGLCKLHSYSIEVLPSMEIGPILKAGIGATGRLGDSCMNKYAGYFEMLRRCADFKIVAVLDENKKLLARSFLWNADIGGETVGFMDRFYTCQDYLDGVLMDYARDNGYWRRYKYDDYKNPQQWVAPSMKIVNVPATVNCLQQGFNKYPYLDTFCYGSDGTLSNSPRGAKYMYQSVFGLREVRRDLTPEQVIERSGMLRMANPKLF